MSWPAIVFEAPLLRGLDDRGRRELERAGALRAVRAGEVVYRRGEKGSALYVVTRGAVTLTGAPRGDDRPRTLRRTAGESFGEEASIGASFRAEAEAVEDGDLAEIPVAMLRRALVRAGGGAVADRIERRLRRRATAELLAASALRLPEAERDLLLDAAEHRSFARGETIFREGDLPGHLWLIADGMVQLQVFEGERHHVRAYLAPGDFFGDQEVLLGEPRTTSAVANGPSLLLAIPAATARTVADRWPGLLRKLRRVETPDGAAPAVAGATQHAFADLYRLSVARSLLVIDLDACVRCGHCAWSCAALHGVARIVRRGDLLLTQVGDDREASPLLLPSSCQHCEHPACMIDCPTGAIGRDPRGEVHIKEALCTGCGACVKACPWDNIQLVARALDTKASEEASAEVAVKCDLCHGYEAPACVEACPTGAIARLDPAADLPAVGRLLGSATPSPAKAAIGGRVRVLGWAAPAAVMAVALASGASLRLSPTRGLGWVLGVVAAAAFVGLFAYVVPKRLMRPRRTRKATRTTHTRSRVRPHIGVHLGLGVLALAAAAGHGGVAPGPSSGGALWWAMLASALFGAVGAVAYATLPPRLARLEKQAALPEDLGARSRALHDRLYVAVTGRSEVIKKLFERVVAPYLRQPLGPLLLLASGRDLVGERRLLTARIDAILAGRSSERLAGLDQVVDLAVELRAVRAQRLGALLLRGFLPLHLVTAAIAAVLLAAHVGGVP